MSARAVAGVEEARRVAAFLDTIGEHKRANDVRHVCRSNDSYRVTLQTLHRDNAALREHLPGSRRPYPPPKSQRCTVRADLLEHAAYLISDRDSKLSRLFERLAVETAA